MQEYSNISIHNYEEHIVNYLDGQSGPVEAAELFLFLELHPELGVDLDDLSQMAVEPDLNVVYDFKELLKPDHDADAQQISSENYLYYFTAYAEGDLSQKGMNAVNRFVDQNPALKSDLLLLEKCKVEAPQTIIYPNKSELKKKTGIIIPLPLRWAALAASLLILFSVYIRLEPTSTESINQILTKTETPVKEKAQSESVKGNPEETIVQTDKQTKNKSGNKKDIVTTEAKQTPVVESIKKERIPALATMPSLKKGISPALPFDATTRQTYSSLFDDISLSQQIKLAYAENHSTEDPRNETRPGLNVGQRFNQYLQTGTQVASQVSESFNGWMLADIGIKGINLLTDKDLRLMREVQQNGTTGNVVLRSDDASYFLKRADR